MCTGEDVELSAGCCYLLVAVNNATPLIEELEGLPTVRLWVSA